MMRTAASETRAAAVVAHPVVVVCQSDADSREMYVEYLSRLNWRPVPLTTGRDVLNAAPQAHAIVTDVPIDGDLDAFALLSALKRDERTATIPVVVVSAWTGIPYRRRAEEAGCDAYLSKPCLPDELANVLAWLMASKPSAPSCARANIALGQPGV